MESVDDVVGEIDYSVDDLIGLYKLVRKSIAKKDPLARIELSYLNLALSGYKKKILENPVSQAYYDEFSRMLNYLDKLCVGEISVCEDTLKRFDVYFKGVMNVFGEEVKDKLFF